MTQLKMNDNDDIEILNNTASLTENDSDIEISQRLKQRLKFFYGEWFLDKTKGLPWFQLIWVKGTKAELIEAAFIDMIIGTDGVTSLQSFDDLDLDSATRKLSVKFDVKTINGETLTINEVLP